MEIRPDQNSNPSGTSPAPMETGEAFFRSLVDDSLDGILLTDMAGIIKFVSPSVKAILGYTPEDLMGRNAFSFVNPEDRDTAIDAFQKEAYRRPEVKYITIRLLTSEGRWLWCMVRGHNLLDNPNLRSIAIYFHDDTLRRDALFALRQSEDLFRHLIANIQVGVALIDRAGRIQMCNQAFSELFLYSQEELREKYVFDILKDAVDEEVRPVAVEDRPLYSAIYRKAKIKDAVLAIYRPKADDRLWLLINVEPVFDDDGNLVHVIYSVKDLSERKKLEAELIQKQLRYQKQITQATIEGQEKERREIGKELHENVGQQLTTVKLFLEIARNAANDATNELLNLALKGISDVINDVRSMSRALVPLTLKDLGLIETLNDLNESVMRAHPLQIALESGEFNEEYVDEIRKLTLFRIVQEQLDHTVKHGTATMVFIRLKLHGGLVLLELEDNGTGFQTNNLHTDEGFSSIRNRVELLDGRFEVLISQTGCSLSVSLPIVPIITAS